MANVPESSASPRPALRPVTDPPPAFELDEARGTGVSLEQALRVVRRYKWSILGLALLGGVIGGLNALSAVPVYRAEARLLVKVGQPSLTTMGQFDSAPMHWLYFKTQSDIIRSRAVAERVVDKIDATAPARPVAATSPSDEETAPAGWWQQVRGTWREIRTEWLPDWRAWLPQGAGEPLQAPVIPERTRRAAAIQGALSVSGGEESEVLVVSFESTDPEHAARVANAVAEAYIEFGLESRVSNVQQATRWLGERIEVLRGKLLDSELALREFQAREGMVGSHNREQIVSSKLASLTAELVRAQTRRSEAELRYKQVSKLGADDAGLEALAGLVNSDLVADTYRERKDQERRMAELAERYGDKHPKMIAARAELKDTERRLQSELRKAAAGVRKEFEIAAAQEQHFQRAIDEQQREMRALSGKAFELDALEKEVEANRRIYESFLERFKQADVAGDYDVTNVRIIDPAQPPSAPYRPNKQRMVMVSLLGGLAVGLLLAFLRLQLDRTFKVKEDVESILRLPVLGMVPKLRAVPWKRVAVESSVRDEPRSSFAEAISDIRTAILFSRVDERLRTILVTSAVPGEGKTTLASNLALSFGQRGRTLLLEGDLRKGRLAEMLGDPRRRGLTDVISSQCSLEDALVPYPDTDQVFVLPGGTMAPNPLELISSQRFASEFERLRSRFDYVVVDGSPLLPVSDSVVLADQCDITVLAVQSERTTHALAREALKRLSGARIRPAGVILQQVDFRRLRHYHGDDSGYGRYYVYRGYYGKSG